jgi:hypothetical protein
MPIKPEHRENTAFSCQRENFQFIKMPFGLNNAPATYQRCIDMALLGLKGIDWIYNLFFHYHGRTCSEITNYF